METKELIKRINELYKKQKQGCISDEEKQEQSKLRQIYLAGIRQQLRAQLSCIDIKEKDGSIHPLTEKPKH